jgi:hypothetical protein
VQGSKQCGHMMRRPWLSARYRSFWRQ